MEDGGGSGHLEQVSCSVQRVSHLSDEERERLRQQTGTCAHIERRPAQKKHVDMASMCEYVHTCGRKREHVRVWRRSGAGGDGVMREVAVTLGVPSGSRAGSGGGGRGAGPSTPPPPCGSP